MSTTPPDPATNDDAWYYFIHGTTTSLWGEATTIHPSGRGDFGAGFYTFPDSRWGRWAASHWARRKAAAGGRPILIRVKLPSGAYEYLITQIVEDDALTVVRQLYWPDTSTGNDLVIGAVSKRGGDGRIADKSLPLQYKFEGTGISQLVFDVIIPVPHLEVP